MVNTLDFLCRQISQCMSEYKKDPYHDLCHDKSLAHLIWYGYLSVSGDAFKYTNHMVFGYSPLSACNKYTTMRGECQERIQFNPDFWPGEHKSEVQKSHREAIFMGRCRNSSGYLNCYVKFILQNSTPGVPLPLLPLIVRYTSIPCWFSLFLISVTSACNSLIIHVPVYHVPTILSLNTFRRFL